MPQDPLRNDQKDYLQESNGSTVYQPSPEEIERCCLEIRQDWSEDEYRRRYEGPIGEKFWQRIFSAPPDLIYPDKNPFD